jgi:hypothetical protein
VIDATTLRRLTNRLSAALVVLDDALLPLLERMPEGGLVGKARAVIQAFRLEFTAIRNELAATDDDPEKTPVRSPSGMMQAVAPGASGVRGIAQRTKNILDEGSK